MASKEYNGHKNRNYWNVSLHLFNDESLYNMVKYHVRTSDTKDEAARNILAELPEKTDDGVKYTFSAIREAIKGKIA